jgi:hypothetical protein
MAFFVCLRVPWCSFVLNPALPLTFAENFYRNFPLPEFHCRGYDPRPSPGTCP